MSLIREREYIIPVVKNAFMRPRIVAFIPAHNEERSIRDCLEGLADQDLPPSLELDIIVIADKCTDRTAEIALRAGEELNLNIMILHTENNKQRKVGALNAAWKSLYGDLLAIHQHEMTPYQTIYNKSVKAILGMDADSRLAPNALMHLWNGLTSARNIGGVMAKYTMRMPKKMSTLSPDDPYYEEKVKSGTYGNPITRWWTHQQKQDMTSWLLSMQYKGGSTYVLGGQGTLFRPEALQDVVNRNNLDAPWQDDSDVEDMLLTWQLQKAKWKTLISPSARCFVDAMKSYHTFRQQRNKWTSGTLDLMTNRELHVHTTHLSKLWASELRKLLDLSTRVLLLLLLSVALITDQFSWNWLWVIPILIASMLNLVLALKTPMRRPIDLFYAVTLVSAEIYLWANLMTFVQVWIDKWSRNKKDGWNNQYEAEKGTTRSKLFEAICLTILIASATIALSVYYRTFLTSTTIVVAIAPYMQIGWRVLTYLTIFVTILMIHQLWTLRRGHTA